MLNADYLEERAYANAEYAADCHADGDYATAARLSNLATAQHQLADAIYYAEANAATQQALDAMADEPYN